jgi:hypothetical protein
MARELPLLQYGDTLSLRLGGMTHFPSFDIGILGRLGRLMLRPTLYITYAGPRITEEVGIQRSHPPFGSFQYPRVNPDVTVDGTARYVRAWVHNRFGFPAYHCQVFVDRILCDGRIIEPERSPLHWTDVDDCFEWSMIRRGYENGHYIDVCSTDSITKGLQVISQKSKKGYHLYRKSGTYRIQMTAEALKPCSFGHFNLTVKFDEMNWKSLQVVCVEHEKKILRWW